MALLAELSIGLENEPEDDSQLLKPGPLEQVSLLSGQVGRQISLTAQPFGLESDYPFIQLNRAVVILVNNLDQAGSVRHLDVELFEDLVDLCRRNTAVLIQIEHFEGLFEGEGLVVEESLLGILDLAIQAKLVLHESE